MIYQFSCPACGKYDEVIRTVDECRDAHLCTDCGQPSNRVFSAPQVSVPHTSTYYDNGLGAIIRNETDKKNALKKIEGETGQKLIEVGTEDVRKHVKPPKMDYDIPRGLFDSAITE
jgi:putative FmdB family regulatory protein